MEKQEVIEKLEKAISDLKKVDFGTSIYNYKISLSEKETHVYVGWNY